MFEVQGRSRSTSVILRVVVLVLLCYTVASGKNKCVKEAESSRTCRGRYYTLRKDLARAAKLVVGSRVCPVQWDEIRREMAGVETEIYMWAQSSFSRTISCLVLIIFCRLLRLKILKISWKSDKHQPSNKHPPRIIKGSPSRAQNWIRSHKSKPTEKAFWQIWAQRRAFLKSHENVPKKLPKTISALLKAPEKFGPKIKKSCHFTPKC